MIPTKDSLLVPYANNFGDRITASPGTFGLTAEQAVEFDARRQAFITAYNTMMSARADGTRSQAQTSEKNARKKALLAYGRELYALVQANTSVSDADKILLGVHVRDTSPSPVPVPDVPPTIEVLSVNQRRVRVRLKGPGGSRRRPEGVAGATVFTHVGNEPPADTGAWQFATNTGNTVLNLNFETSAQADTVWLTAFWFNTRKESGPAAPPISVNLPAAQSVPQGAKLKIAA